MLDEFTIDDIRFGLEPLPPKQAAQLLAPLIEVIRPAVLILAEQAESIPSDAESLDFNLPLSDLIKAVAQSADGLPRLMPLIEAFQAHCKYVPAGVTSRTQGKIPWVPFDESGFNATFRRKHVRMIKWLVKCVQLEFGDFLSIGGLSLSTGTANLSDSQSGSQVSG